MASTDLSTISPGYIEGVEEDREEQVDSFLENWRSVRKDSDSYTDHGGEGRKFLKKRASVLKDLKG